MNLQSLFYIFGVIYFLIGLVFLIVISFVLMFFYLKLKKQINQFTDIKNARLVLNKFEEWAKKPKPAFLPLAIFILSFFLNKVKKVSKRT